MHIFCSEQEGGAALTLGCREGGGHQRARSSCVQEDREGVKSTDTEWAIFTSVVNMVSFYFFVFKTSMICNQRNLLYISMIWYQTL